MPTPGSGIFSIYAVFVFAEGEEKIVAEALDTYCVAAVAAAADGDFNAPFCRLDDIEMLNSRFT